MNLEQILIDKAKAKNKKIVFPEAEFSPRIIEAVKIIANEKIAQPLLIGNTEKIKLALGEKYDNVTIIDPKSFENIDQIVEHIYEKRKAKGMTREEANALAFDPIYFANAYVDLGLADGIVCGAEVSTAKTLKPALQIIKSKTGLVASYFLFSGKNNVTDDVFMMGDCAVVEYPSAEQECQIAELMLEENKKFNLFEPRFAFLSYSTLASAKSESIEKVQNAYKMFTEKYPDIKAVGEVQFDASVLERVAKTKMPNQEFFGPANMFVMPNIDAGNICYKAIQYFGGLKAIGPITMGFNKPVNDLSRGCNVEEIVLASAITAIQCEWFLTAFISTLVMVSIRYKRKFTFVIINL